eukprot:5900132-Alexandrium_andersonii.AAC.1
MSASLVGSEMCIRDRASEWPPHRIPPAAGVGRVTRRTASASSRVSSVASFSVSHFWALFLRAAQ